MRFIYLLSAEYSCICKSDHHHWSSLTIYDVGQKPRIRCDYIKDNTTTTTTTTEPSSDNKTLNQCPWKDIVSKKETCLYKYINYTLENVVDSSKSIGIGQFNWKSDQSCSICDLRYNTRYQDYCVFNDLLKSFLGYNSFITSGQLPRSNTDLKVIVFLCSVLQMQRVCQHLANLCILSHHSFYKYSPCRRFLMSQTSSFTYGMDHLLQSEDQIQIQVAEDTEEPEIPAVTPFLYFSKGKEITNLLQQPIAVRATL